MDFQNRSPDASIKLDLPAPGRRFAVGQQPHIGLNAGVVEQVGRQGDDRLDPIVLQHPAADFAFARIGAAGEERRAVHDDADARAGLIIAHLRNHVLEEKQLAVGDARQARAEASFRAKCLRLFPYRVLVLLPVHAVGRIGQHVVKRFPPVRIVRQRVAEGYLLGVVAGHQHVRFADTEGLAVQLLAEQLDADRGVELLQRLFCQRQHAAGPTGRVIDLPDDALPGQLGVVVGDEQFDDKADDLARREMFACRLVRDFREPPDQILE